MKDYFNLYNCEKNNKQAIKHDSASVSYAVLFEKANILISILKENGIKSGNKICICMENSIDFIIATVACLKMGCVCVPISSDVPTQRVSDIIDDCGANALLMNNANKMDLISLSKSKFLVIPVNNEMLVESKTNGNMENTAETLPPIDLDNVIYILYTSGSTGKPKGVEIVYKGLINYVDETLLCLRIKENSKILITNPFSFDASFGYIFCALKARAEIIIYNNKLLMPRFVLSKIEQYKVTHYACTPSFLCKLIDYVNEKKVKHLPINTISFGAENIFHDQIKKVKAFKKKYPYINIINRYGATETTIAVSAYEVFSDELEYIPIGNPYKNVAFYVLNSKYEEVGCNNVGELYVAGIQNMKGYCNDQALTKKVLHFIKGQLLYKTSDIVFINNNGEYIFRSRADDMIKRGGKRVYISEIENIMRNGIGIMDASCICVTVNDEAIIIGFVVQKNERYKGKETELYLKSQYPSYLIPDKIIEIDEIPKTSIGKTDRNELLEIYYQRMGKTYETK